MRGDLFFFLGILLLFFVVWLASGGPDRPISFAGPYLNPITTTGTTAQPYGDPGAWNPFSSNISIGPTGVGITNYGGSAQPSTRKGSAMLSRNLSGVSATDPEEEYVIISVSSFGGTSVSTAGWKLVNQQTNEGGLIPPGTKLPATGRVNELSPITLAPGEEMIVVTGRSPIGLSFRENKCVGYLEDRQDFSPPLSAQCPTPYQEFSQLYDVRDDDEYEECEHYVRTLPYCALDTDVPNDLSNSCERFVEEVLSYNGCVALHDEDGDFAGYTWRVFLGEREELWGRRGTILLLDAEDKVIDSLTY
ncbi:MAG: hypothetical protein WBK28_01670 [Minisyncoccia bacterium]